ncbi:uncharacterized protein [Asterias amurensis]|uniref:uncharacterized protein n=1 Tax=Asterias amurensis TaxID=7602 RepID=UPI003AB4248A
MSSEVKQEVYESLQMDSDVQATTITSLENQCSSLKNTNNDMLKKLDDLEQYSRRNCLLLHGLDESHADNKGTSIDCLNHLLPDLHLQSSDIDRAHRIGKPNLNHNVNHSGQRRSRPVIIKFISYAKREAAFRTKRLLKGSGLSLSESLTPTRMSLLKAAQDSSKTISAWTIDGRVICLLANNRKVTVTSIQDLDKL